MDTLKEALKFYGGKGYYVYAHSADRTCYYLNNEDDSTCVTLNLNPWNEVTASLTATPKWFEISWTNFQWNHPDFDEYRSKMVKFIEVVQSIDW